VGDPDKGFVIIPLSQLGPGALPMISIQTIHGEHEHQIENLPDQTSPLGSQYTLDLGFIRWIRSKKLREGFYDSLNLMKKRRLGSMDIRNPARQQHFFVGDVEVKSEREVVEDAPAGERLYVYVHPADPVSIIDVPLDGDTERIGRHAEPERDAPILRRDLYKAQVSVPSR